MGQFTDALKAHTSAPERRIATVTLNGTEVTLFATPLTGTDLDRLMIKHKNFASAPTVNATVDLLISKAETDAGDKAFGIDDKPFLLKMPIEWINDLRAKLFPDQDVELSDEAIEREMGN
jgi:hypothetical protein